MTAEEQGIFIRTLRTAKGLSIKELAAFIGVRPGCIYNLETGSSFGTIETLEKIEHALGIRKGTLKNPKPRHNNGAYDPTGLKALRRSCNLTQSEVALVFGITRNALNNLEQRQTEHEDLIPQIKDFLLKLAKLKGLSNETI